MKPLPTRHGALLIAACAHAVLLWPLLAIPEVAPRLASAPVMTVSLVSTAEQSQPPTPAPQKSTATPVRPVPQLKPTPRPVAAPQPVVHTPEPALAAAPTTSVAVATPVAAAQPVTTPATAAQPVPSAVPAAPAEAPVVEARFDAGYLNNPKPAYPPLARRLGEQGQVLLRAYVRADGRPEQIELRRSSGSARLDTAAQETVRLWRFVPARRGDTPTAAWVLIPINFRLDS